MTRERTNAGASPRATLALAAGACLAAGVLFAPGAAWAQADRTASDRIVLANVDTRPVTVSIASRSVAIAPSKAKAFHPTTLPFVLRYGNGTNPTGWKSMAISTVGVFLFRYENGEWTVTRRTPPTPAVAMPTTERPRSAPVSNRERRGVDVRVTTITGGGSGGSGGAGGANTGLEPLAFAYGVTGGMLDLYRFIQDERDRDMFRDFLRHHHWRDCWHWCCRDNGPHILPTERDEFEQRVRDLGQTTDAEWQRLEKMSPDEWNQVKHGWDQEGIAQGFSQKDWDEITGDPRGNLPQLGQDLGIDLKEDELKSLLGNGNLEAGDAGWDLDLGPDLEMEDMDWGEDLRGSGVGEENWGEMDFGDDE